ncbi:hypothetical protein EB061_02200 [bacterium]|jgi:outer membrane protein OmpA-like peptidoglycan-associated protein|nr:hypothetical protein [bacterium]
MKKTFALVLAALALSACGKSLHVSEKPKPKLQIKRNMLGEPIAQKLGGFSSVDLEEVKTGDLVLPFGEAGKEFRALHFLPEADLVEKVTSLKLSLKELKISNVAVDDNTDLSKLTLCVLQKDFKYCSGSEMPSGFTALVEGGKLPITADANAKGSFNIDLLEAFALQSKDAGQVMAFLKQISSDYDGKGYRKFRFSIGKNLEYLEGSLELQTELKKGTEPVAVEVPGTPIQTGDDQYATEEEFKVVAKEAEDRLRTAVGKPANENVVDAMTRSEPEKLIVEKSVDSTSILFSGKIDGTQYLQPAAEEKLNRITNLIATYKESIGKVFIQVQTDRDGSTERNVTLSTARAEYIRKNLLDKAPDLGDRTVAAGLGAVEASSCAPQDKCLKDRKFTITLTMKDGSKTADLQTELNAIQ